MPTDLTVRSFCGTHQSHLCVSNLQSGGCARLRKLSRLPKVHCVSRTCKLSWRRSVQRRPKRSWVFTLQSVVCRLISHWSICTATFSLCHKIQLSLVSKTFFHLISFHAIKCDVFLKTDKKKKKELCAAPSLLFWHFVFSDSAAQKWKRHIVHFFEDSVTSDNRNGKNEFAALSVKA